VHSVRVDMLTESRSKKSAFDWSAAGNERSVADLRVVPLRDIPIRQRRLSDDL